MFFKPNLFICHYYCVHFVYLVRHFQPKDTFPVIHLASKVLTEHYDSSLFSYLYETTPWGFWVCEYKQEIIGFIIGIQFQERVGRILMIGIEKAYRKKGIAQSLLKQILIEFQKRFLTTIELEVKTTNTKAIKFYQKNQFKIEEKIPHFYQNGEDAYLMKRVLPTH